MTEPEHGAQAAPIDDAIQLRVNGVDHVVSNPGLLTLATWLREDLRLTGTKLSCEQGFCGACSVIVDDDLTSACSVLVCDLDGCQVVTVEGLCAGRDLHPVQQAFLDCRGFQCGFCTPGMVMATVALLAESPQPSEQEIRDHFAGNLCRCTGYASIRDAVRQAAALAAAPSPGQT